VDASKRAQYQSEPNETSRSMEKLNETCHRGPTPDIHGLSSTAKAEKRLENLYPEKISFVNRTAMLNDQIK